MTIAPPAAPIRVDEAGRLDEDLDCIRCGYNLRAALAEGRCPECGLAVGRSARGHWLRYCDPDWLRTIWGGLNRLAILLMCGLGLVTLSWSGLLDLRTPLPEWLVNFLIAALLCTGLVVGIHGVWRATTPDPAALAEPRLGSRRLTRVLLVIAVPSLPLLGMVLFIRYEWLLVPLLSLLLMTTLLLGYGRSLALRIPRLPLARTTMVIAAVLLISGTAALWLTGDWFNWTHHLMTAIHGPGYYYSPYASAWFYPWLDIAVEVTTLLFLIALTLVAPLFFWYWAVMKREARIARETWARQPHPRAARPDESGESTAEWAQNEPVQAHAPSP